MDVSGHGAIVAGGASGLGAATVRALAAAGAKVAVLDVNIEVARETAGEIGGVAIECDVTSSERAEAAVDQAVSEIGGPRVLVNCAGIGPAERILVGKVRSRSITTRAASMSTWSARSTCCGWSPIR